MKRPKSKTKRTVTEVARGEARSRRDVLATEEPLELRLIGGGSVGGGQRQTVAITMRTPGADFELVAGFLFCEGILQSQHDIDTISYCVDTDVEQRYNIVNVRLRGTVLGDRAPELRGLERHFYTTSACGVCGKASLDALEIRGCETLPNTFSATPELITALPRKLRDAQGLFEATGGLHAAALFSKEGDLLAVREDVGRHNALDKLIGWALLEGRLPLSEHIVMLSGRASFELLQKSLAAGVQMVCAVSAPSSLAVSVAERFGLTLIGFLRGERFNIYTGDERVALSETTLAPRSV